MSRHVLMVLTNATEGDDGEFNRWYDEVNFTEPAGPISLASSGTRHLSDRPPPFPSRVPLDCLTQDSAHPKGTGATLTQADRK